MIDIHCHAEHGQQDALSVGKLASANGMYGLLYKSIGKEDKRSAGPMEDVKILLQDLDRWSQETGIAPIKAWGGYALCRDNKPPNRDKVMTQIKAGVSCVLDGARQPRQHLFDRRRQEQALGSDGRFQGAFRSAALGAGPEVRPLRAERQGQAEARVRGGGQDRSPTTIARSRSGTRRTRRSCSSPSSSTS